MENVNQVNDPLANMMPPSFGDGTDHDNIKVTNGDQVMLGPGVDCGKIEVSGGTPTFEPGDHVLDQAGFTVASNGAVRAIEMQICLTMYLYRAGMLMDLQPLGAETCPGGPSSVPLGASLEFRERLNG